MLKFNENEVRNSINGALALRKDINTIIDNIGKDIKNICFIGIGGTWASAMQVYVHMKEYSELEVIVENASEYNTTSNKRIGKGSLVVLSSVSGTTKEMIESVQLLHNNGAIIIGFIDNKDSILAKMVDYCISYKANEQLKFFMLADYIMHINNEIDWYEELYRELDLYLADILIDVEKTSDSFGKEFAYKHHKDQLHYFVGAGNMWGATYSYAMCYWEEQHWLRTKSIMAGEFFHGMFEIIDEDTPITLYIGEDSQRELCIRVKNFLPKVNKNYTIIDTRDYDFKGLSTRFRGMISHLVMRAINSRIDVYIEDINKHDMSIRRYYRQVEY